MSSQLSSPIKLYSLAEQQTGQQSQVLLFKSAKLGEQEAKAALLKWAINNKDHYWLGQLAALDSASAAYQKGLISQTERKQRYWFTLASDLGHAASQFELSLLLDKHQQRFDLLKSAAEKGYVPAVITLASYLKQSADDTSKEERLFWLKQAAKHDPQSEFDLAMLLYRLGDTKNAITRFKTAAQNGVEEAEAFAEVLETYSVKKLDALYSQSLPKNIANKKTPGQCAQVLQFVANDLPSMAQAHQFTHAFYEDERLSELAICINSPLWLSESDVSCKSTNDTARINCDLSSIASNPALPSFTHLVMFAESGKAYVQRGVMYLDLADTYSVFVHELAHFANFVDEYPMSSELAQQHCYSTQAPNLLLEDSQGRVDKESLKVLRKSTSANLGPSKTCASLDISSYKPSTDMTFLEYHDIDYIPDAYIGLWQKQLADSFGRLAFTDEMLWLSQLKGKAEQSKWQEIALIAQYPKPADESVRSTSP